MSAIDIIALLVVVVTIIALPEMVKARRAKRQHEREVEGIRAFEAQRKALRG